MVMLARFSLMLASLSWLAFFIICWRFFIICSVGLLGYTRWKEYVKTSFAVMLACTTLAGVTCAVTVLVFFFDRILR